MSAELTPPHRCGVLIIDDDAEVRELLPVSLATDGYRVATVRDGREALTYLRSHADTCMLLLDLLLPTMDGARFRAAQLRDRSLAWTPVVLMSGGVEAAEKARAFGARGFLRKPLDLDQVRTTLRNVGCYHLHPRATCAGRCDLPASPAHCPPARPSLRSCLTHRYDRKLMAAEHAGRQTASAPPLILIVEDDVETRQFYTHALRVDGFRTDQAHNGLQAFEKAVQDLPDLILTDIAVPGIDGIELCRRLRADQRTRGIPLLAITGYGDREYEHRARGAGADRVLIKPCSADMLTMETRRLLANPPARHDRADEAARRKVV